VRDRYSGRIPVFAIFEAGRMRTDRRSVTAATLTTMTKRIALTISILAAFAVAVPAFAGITVYNNNFKAKSSYKEIRKQSGKKKRCKREWRKKSALGVTVKGGKQNCALKTPVEGDSSQPDLIVKALTKLTGKTDKAARKGAYLGVAVRASKKDGYVFRVVPKARKWELLENGVVVEKGKDADVVAGFKKKNVIEIRVKGGKVSGRVNGEGVVNHEISDPGQVKGTGTGLVYGNKQKVKGKKKAVGFFDDLRVQVPNP
jgi:hypothetical protein